MRKYNILILLALCSTLFSCIFLSPKGYFSKQVKNMDVEPQTDDERILVGEFKDYLSFVDSLANVWDGKDTMTMRRLYYNQREQYCRLLDVKKYKNIRRTLHDAVEHNMDEIDESIKQKLSLETCHELYTFYECYNLNRETTVNWPPKVVDGKIHTNIYREYYILENTKLFKRSATSDIGYKLVDVVIKHPLTYRQVKAIRKYYDNNPIKPKGYRDDSRNLGTNTTQKKSVNFTQPEIVTLIDATEIDWCEECNAKQYSCCPKCKTEEQKDCQCGCEDCRKYGNTR